MGCKAKDIGQCEQNLNESWEGWGQDEIISGRVSRNEEDVKKTLDWRGCETES